MIFRLKKVALNTIEFGTEHGLVFDFEDEKGHSCRSAVRILLNQDFDTVMDELFGFLMHFKEWKTMRENAIRERGK